MRFLFGYRETTMVAPDDALPGREERPFTVPGRHAVLDTPFEPPFPENMETAVFGLGCFWGAERIFWKIGGVYTTAVGYAGGRTPNPTYEEVCSGRTGHTEAVLVVFDPEEVTYRQLLVAFWEGRDPTHEMRQGNDVGTQYRSAIYYEGDDQRKTIEETRAAFEKELWRAGYGPIVTEIAPAGPFYYAEGYHQQYLHKNPNGYCGIGGTGVSCPVGFATDKEPVPDAGLKPLAGNDAEWRKRLAREHYAALREAGTERPLSGEFVQITADDERDVPIPDEAGSEDSSLSFGVLTEAQALGDRQALLDTGRRVIRFHMGSDVTGGLARLGGYGA